MFFEIIFSSIQDTIEEKLEKEINKQVDTRVTKFVEYISQTYDVSLRLLLRDLQNLDGLQISNSTKPGQCSGVTKTGGRCKCKAVNRGYCKRHQNQFSKKREKEEIEMQDFVSHNHPIPPIFDPNCPACSSTKKEKNLLIEL